MNEKQRQAEQRAFARFRNLREMERAYYAAQGRLREALVIIAGGPPMPKDSQTEDAYAYLALFEEERQREEVS